VDATVAEYLVNGLLRGAEGFDKFHDAAAHHTDLAIVAAAYGEACMNVGNV